MGKVKASHIPAMPAVRVLGICGKSHLILQNCTHGADVQRAISTAGLIPARCSMQLFVGTSALGDTDLVLSQEGAEIIDVTAVASFVTFGVVTWGESMSGGDSSDVAVQLAGGVVSIASTERAFAALK